MTKTKIYSLSYFLGRTFFLGFGFSLLFRMLNKDTWIASLLGSILGFILLFLFDKYKENHPLSSIIQKSIFFLYNFFIFTQILFIFEIFCSSFYLIKSPIFYIILPVPFIIYQITKKGITTIAKITEVLFPFSLLLYILVTAGLFKNVNLEYFTPILTSNENNLFLGTLYFAIFSTAPFFLLWNVETKKSLSKAYVISMVGVFIVALFITAILGPNLAQIYRFPEYMTLKKIKLFNFIEKVENVISVTWLFDCFILLSVAANNMKELLPSKRRNVVYVLLLVVLSFIALYCGIHYKQEFWFYHNLPIILGTFIVLMFFISLFQKKRGKS